MFDNSNKYLLARGRHLQNTIGEVSPSENKNKYKTKRVMPDPNLSR